MMMIMMVIYNNFIMICLLRRLAEKWREISTLSTPDWCFVRHTGERLIKRPTVATSHNQLLAVLFN